MSMAMVFDNIDDLVKECKKRKETAITKDDILKVVANKFCDECCCRAMDVVRPVLDCKDTDCLYKDTYYELKKRLDMAEKQVEAFLMEGTKE